MLFYAVESTLDHSNVTTDTAVCLPRLACFGTAEFRLSAIARCSLTGAPVSAQYPRSNCPLLSSRGCTAWSNRSRHTDKSASLEDPFHPYRIRPRPCLPPCPWKK